MKIPALDDAAVRAPMVEPIRTESPTNASRNRAESGSASSCADPLGGISISSTTTTTGKRWNYCPECGMKLELGWKHCPGCGQAIGEVQLAPIYWPVPYYPPTQPWFPLTLVSSSANLDWATKYRFATATATDYLLWDSDDCKSGELMNCPTCSKPRESGIRCPHCGVRCETRIDSIPDTIDAIIHGWDECQLLDEDKTLAEQFALWEKQLEERACREPK